MAEQSTCARVEPAETERIHSSCAETKQKSIKKPTGWNSFMQSVAVSLFCISRNIQSFSAWIKCLFKYSETCCFPYILYIRLQMIKIKWSEISVKNKPHLKFSFMSLTNILSISVALVFVILIGLEITFDISWYSFLVLCIIPQPDVKEQLGKGAGIGQVSKVVGNMWKKLPTDRRKVSYKLLTLRMFVY